MYTEQLYTIDKLYELDPNLWNYAFEHWMRNADLAQIFDDDCEKYHMLFDKNGHAIQTIGRV